MSDLILWIKRREPAIVIPILDKFIILLFKLFYLASYIFLRLSFRLILGKQRRNDLLKKVRFNYEFEFVPIFYYFKFLQFIRKQFSSNKNFLLKITVPRYNYKIYSPIDKNQLIQLTIREDEIIEKFNPQNGKIVVDVGAHYGRYTLIAAKRIGPKGKVISIEADPKNFELLNKNIKLNKLDNVTAINYAASSEIGKIKLYTPEKEAGHTIYNTIMYDRTDSKEKFIEVNANTLDNILSENGIPVEQVNWIKIDVEGAELEVLKGATNILAKSKDISILLEIHNIGNGKTLYEPIMNLLNDYNFRKEFEMIYENGERHIIIRKIR